MTQETLNDAELRDLRALAGLMIPASGTYGVPGADDELIFAEIVKNLERDMADARTALKQLAGLSGGSFAALSLERRAEVAAHFKQEGGAPLFALNRVVLLCYYRDDRVMRSLGQEPRAPFPKGHVVEQGDWSLLDPVRQRAPMWRRV
ncbi:hypothetical protein KQ910_18005 [Reyranella sp. MMS21-HV4-11]|jgi:hypothetical protein|uniref:Gluconate 2-dehydrogenase subunit 3 family protein n=1 Tax=Reyranella humidisoli TaxID=2849149 RepID=A0ABS6IR35_9HYPH|nr:hypothetical protein [Reyranella sp. MMS21-HV4-11]MBU8875673.1 hypothetical protein [Reyranella sp. MMS21-HV4-11]